MNGKKIDWIEEFEKKFSTHEIIAELKKLNYHGKVTINFAEGSPCTVHLEWCVKAYAELKVGGEDATS
mgnify:CR=1 FL=1